MTQPVLYVLIALASLFVGAGVMLLLIRQRARTSTQAHTQNVTELAVARENVRLQSEERSQMQSRLNTLQAESEGWRSALDEANNQRALLGERASRLAPLEARLEELEQRLAQGTSQSTQLGEAVSRLQAELDAERSAHADSRNRAKIEAEAHASTEAKRASASEELTRLSTQYASEREQFAEKLAFIEDAKRTLSDQFKNLANDILEEKGKRFAEQNQTNLGNLLDPLKQKLTEFQSKVEDVYVKEGKDRTALAEQVKQLMGLNQTLSDDAKNLTSALKGSNKTQGNWGELVLERVLESSGLRKGHEYRIQESHAQEDGRRLQPDIIISLPEDRSLVVDSKVSLTAYEECVSADNDKDREGALNRHLASIRGHIKGLSGKNYQAMYQLRSLDFVLMFIPIEPAFMLAVSNDQDLFQEAWNRNVLLVSPSTLMFVLRTVAHLWRQEAQTRNAQDIARRGAELYDHLCEFTKDLAKVGVRLRQAQESYDGASNKLSRNKGNVIRQAEMLRDLGVKPTKTLAPAFLQLSGIADEDADVAIDGERLLLEATKPGPQVASNNMADADEVSEERIRPGRRVNPDSKLSRAREIVFTHMDTHEPRDIKRLMVELLDISPAVANTYFCQVRNDMTDGQETVVGTEA
jgi:DNA recombination protein RmuC